MKNMTTSSTSLVRYLVLLISALGTFTFAAGEAFSQDLEALLTIEFNALAGDLGFHGEFDGSPWKQIEIKDPVTGETIFEVQNQGSLEEQGVSGLTFESAEPGLDEFLARFPEGEYRVIGETIEGEILESIAEFTHNIPGIPRIISPLAGEVLDRDEVVIAWEPVTGPEGIEIEVYRLQVFPVDPPAGQDPIPLNIDLTYEVPSTFTEVEIPAVFLMPGEEYAYELTVVESGGNRTLEGGTFKTEDEKDKAEEDDDDL